MKSVRHKTYDAENGESSKVVMQLIDETTTASL